MSWAMRCLSALDLQPTIGFEFGGGRLKGKRAAARQTRRSPPASSLPEPNADPAAHGQLAPWPHDNNCATAAQGPKSVSISFGQSAWHFSPARLASWAPAASVVEQLLQHLAQIAENRLTQAKFHGLEIAHTLLLPLRLD